MQYLFHINFNLRIFYLDGKNIASFPYYVRPLVGNSYLVLKNGQLSRNASWDVGRGWSTLTMLNRAHQIHCNLLIHLKNSPIPIQFDINHIFTGKLQKQP